MVFLRFMLRPVVSERVDNIRNRLALECKPANLSFLFYNSKFRPCRGDSFAFASATSSVEGDCHVGTPFLLAMTNLWFEELTVDDRTAEGEFVGIFEVVTETEAARKGRHLDTVLLYLAVYVE